MQVNIKNLEKLACLSLTKTQEDKIAKSIEGVIDMINTLPDVSEQNTSTDVLPATKFRPENSGVEFVPHLGVNIDEQGYFLAPKVIKKD